MTNVSPAAPQTPSAPAPVSPAPAPAPASATTSAAPGPERGKLVLIRPDGSEGESFPLSDATTVGRESAGPFASDSYLSPRHAEFRFQGNQLSVRDLESLNGIYLRIPADQPIELQPGAVFRIGQEILRFEATPSPSLTPDGTEPMGSPNPGIVGRILLVVGRDSHSNGYCVPTVGMHLGRERGDVIFPEDGYVSGLHCRLHNQAGRTYLTDVGSSNGTFLRIEGQAPVLRGSLLLMGQQLFRVEF